MLWPFEQRGVQPRSPSPDGRRPSERVAFFFLRLRLRIYDYVSFGRMCGWLLYLYSRNCGPRAASFSQDGASPAMVISG
jgi:hypothetical protein